MKGLFLFGVSAGLRPVLIPLASNFLLIATVPSCAVAQGATSDVRTLIVQLGDRNTEWAAASGLQKLGNPAIVALVANLRLDPITDFHHGSHSPTMRVLAKIGEPAVAELERALTLVSGSASTTDVSFAQTVIHILSRIGGERVAPILIDLATSAGDERLRAAAYSGLAWDTGDHEWRWPWRPWEYCLVKDDPRWCPIDAKSQRVAAAVQPLLRGIQLRLFREVNPNMRIAAAHVLAYWGEGATKAAAEQIILSGYPAGKFVTKRAPIMELFSRGDTGYVQLATQLLNLQTGSPPYLGEDGTARRWAIQFAVRSHNVAFVPALIDMLGSSDFNGMTSTTSRAGITTVTRFTFAVDAFEALRRLTFQDFGPDAQRWREWWAANSATTWGTLLARHVQSLLPQLATAEPQVIIGWMNELLEADDPAVLPFVTAVFRHPRLHTFSYSPDSRRIGEGIPGSLRLLLNLTSQGSREARELIFTCSNTTSANLAIECSRLVVMLGDRERGLDRLNALLGQDWKWRAALTLVELGDKRGIPVLINLLGSGSNAERSLSYRALRQFTQEDIPENSLAWQQWWRGAESTFTVKVHAARIDELDIFR